MTTWTKRSAPASTTWLEGEITHKKMNNNFYYAGGGFVSGLSPSKRSDNFYDLAGTSYPGSFLLGIRVDNFVEARIRT